MKETPFDEQIKQAESAIKEAQVCLESLLKRRAEYICPVKIGDVIYSREGSKAKVTGLKLSSAQWGYVLIGDWNAPTGGKHIGFELPEYNFPSGYPTVIPQ